MPASFELLKNDDGQFCFQFLDGAGELILKAAVHRDRG